MNIIEYLQTVVPIEKAWPGMRNNPHAQLSYLNRIEMEIREGIAQELEQLVITSATPEPHGIPDTASVELAAGEYMPMLNGIFSLLQQDFFRGAANVVRGKNPATEEDWIRQSERMRAMAQLQALRDEKAEIFPMPSDAELQRKFEQDEERKREWND